MKKADEPTVHDLRDITPPATPNPNSPKEGHLSELVHVSGPHIVTPDVGTEPEGQTTHE